MAEKSVSQIVQQISETLSDSVSKLVLMVIAFQEQNAAVPPELPGASGAVGKAAEVLVKVAKSLAAEEYEDFPSIQKKIVDAANAVDVAKDGLISSVNNLKTAPDRQAGWSSLLDACKVIAGKTILLLQIVYGAELERIFLSALGAKDALDNVDADQLKSNPSEFAKNASKAASDANQFGQYLKEKAKAAPSDYQREQLEKLGDGIQNKARKLLDDINQLIRNPDSKPHKDKVQKGIDDLKNDIANSVKPLEDEKKHYENLDPEREFAQDLSKKQAEMEPYRRDAPMRDAPISAKPEDVDAFLAREDDRNNDYVEAARKAAAEVPDPKKQRNLFDNIDELEDMFPQQREAKREALLNPTDAKAQKAADDLDKKVRDLKDDIDGVLMSPVERIDALGDRALNDLDDLDDLVDAGDRKGAAQKLKDVLADVKALAANAQEFANEQSPAVAREVKVPLQELERLVPSQVSALKDWARDPDPKKKKALHDLIDALGDKIDDVVNATQPEDEKLLRRINDLGDLLDKQYDAAKAGAPADVVRMAPPVQQRAEAIANQARNASKAAEPADAAKLRKLADDIQNLIPKEAAAAKAAAQDPSPTKLKQLADAMDDLMDKVESVPMASMPVEMSIPFLAKRIEDNLDKARDAAGAGDQPKVDRLEKAIGVEAKKFDDAGRPLAASQSDPKKKRGGLDGLDELKRAVPPQQDAARSAVASPEDVGAQKRLGDQNNKIKDALGHVIDAIAGPEDALKRLGRDLKDGLDQLNDAIARGDVPAANKALDDVLKNIDKIVDLARSQAPLIDDPARKRKVLDGADALEKMKPVFKAAAQDAARDPKNPEKKKKVDDLSDKIKDAIDDILRNLADPGAQVANAARALAEDIDGLEHAARNNDPQGVADAARDMAKDLDTLKGKVGEAAKAIPDPDRRKQLLDAVDTLPALVGDEIAAAQKAAKNPNDTGALQDLDDVGDMLKDAIQHVVDIANPTPAQKIKDGRDAARKALAELMDSAAKGNQPAVTQALDKARPAIGDVADNARRVARDEPNAVRKKLLADDADALDKALEKLPGDARALAASPSDAAKKKALADDIDHLNKLMDEIADKSLANPRAEADKMLRDLDQLADALRREDPPAISDASKKVADRFDKKLKPAVNQQAKTEEDPIRKKNLLDAVSELEGSIPYQVKLNKDSVNKPGDEPTKRKALDNIDELKDSLNKILGQPNDKQTPSKSKMLRAADDMDALLPKIKDMMAKANKSDDPTIHKNLDDLLDQLANAVGDAAPVDNRDKIDFLADKIKIDAVDLANAAKAQDAPALVAAAKALADDKDKLKAVVGDGASAAPGRTKDLLDTIDEIGRLLPKEISAAKQVLKDNKDPRKLRPLMDAMDSLIDNANMVQDAVKPPPEDDLNNALNAAKRAVEDAKRDAAAGNKPRTEDDLGKLRDAADDIKDSLGDIADKSDPARKKKLDDLMDQLNRLNDQFDDAARKAAADPKDSNTKPMEAKAKQLMDLLDKIDDATGASPVAAAKELDRLMNDLGEKLRRRDLPGFKDTLEELKKKLPDWLTRPFKFLPKGSPEENDLAKHLKSLRDKWGKTLGDIKKSVPDLNKGGAPALKAVDTINDDVADARDDLNAAIAILDPTLPNRAAAAAAAQKNNLAKLRNAAGLGDKAAVKKALKDVDDGNKDLKKIGDEVQKAPGATPGKKKRIQDAIDQLERLAKEVADPAQKAVANPKDAAAQDALRNKTLEFTPPIDTIVDEAKLTDEDEKSRKGAEADFLLADLKDAKKGGKFTGDLLDAASKLTDCLNDLIGSTRNHANNMREDPGLSDRAKAALDLDRLLSDLERDAKKAPTSSDKDVSELLDSLNDIVAEKPKPSTASPDSFEGKINQVAAGISSAVEAEKAKNKGDDLLAKEIDGEPSLKTALQIADELNRLASNAAKKNKQDVLVSGRKIAALINQFIKQIEALAASCPDPYTKDQLLQFANGLRNYATQLRILISIQAASLGEDKHSDNKVVNMAQTLGASLQGAIRNITTAKIKIYSKSRR